MKVMQPVRGDSPKDDVYPYRLEVTEVWSATNETPYVYQTQKSGESAINIKEGDGLKIGYGAMFVPSVRAYKQIVTLNKVPRREPKEIKTMKDLEEFLGPDKKAK
jgi:hypothetical protein